MSAEVQIKWLNKHVGKWVFDLAPEQLNAKSTLNGFCVNLPSRIVGLSTLGDDNPQRAYCPVVSNMRVIIAGKDGAEIGIADNTHWYHGAARGIDHDNVPLEWRGSLESLVRYERKRNGGPVVFNYTCYAEVCVLIPQGDIPRQRSAPERVFGGFQISYPVEKWTEMLNSLHAMRCVLVEFPMRSSPPSPWDDVWEAVADAQESLKKGGSTGWKGCVDAVRLALEKWQQIPGEKEDMGNGWQAPSVQDRKARTKEQRLDNLRWHLMQCAHLGPHSHAKDWTRDDAVLLLSALCGLLSERQP